MRKKTFFQWGFGVIWTYLVLFTIIGFCVFYIALAVYTDYSIIDYLYLDVLLITVVVLGGCIYYIVAVFSYRIVLEKNYIYAPKDMPLTPKIQFKTKVYYKEIIDIRTTICRNNSLNQSRGKDILTRLFETTSVTYIVLTCKDGSQHRISVNDHSKKQRVKIIDELTLRVINAGNDTNFIDIQ